MDHGGHHNVTVSILDVSLALVHIPRSRMNELTRPILKQLLRKNPKFLSLTANELELSIFAEDGELDDFVPIARRDRNRIRQGANSAASVPSGRRKRRSSFPEASALEMSLENWKVLQIDSHDDSQCTYYVLSLLDKLASDNDSPLTNSSVRKSGPRALRPSSSRRRLNLLPVLVSERLHFRQGIASPSRHEASRRCRVHHV